MKNTQNYVTKPMSNSNNNKFEIATAQKQEELINNYMLAVVEAAKKQGKPLTLNEVEFAKPIVNNLVKRIVEEQRDLSKLNLSDFIDQTKSYARLGLSIHEKELYFDIRNNGKTNMIDVTLKKQYQGIKKELTKFCTKQIVRFLDGVVYDGDIFESEIDFENGLEKVVKHVKKDCNQKTIQDIKCAYAIAYCQENGKLVPYTAIVGKKRILRAFNAAQTKTIWNTDTEQMVKKTAYWVLANNIMQPYMEISIELKEDWKKTEDVMNWNEEEKETIYDIDNEIENKLEENEVQEEESNLEEKVEKSLQEEEQIAMNIPDFDDEL